jgi:protein transport protein SEC24
VTDSILENLETLPGDSRTLIGFIAYNSSVHFFNLALNCQMMTVTDVDDVFVPCPEGLLVGLKEKEENVRLFLRGINGMFPDHDNGNCLGSAVAVGQKLLVSLF